MRRVPGTGLTEREYFALLAASEEKGGQMSPLRMQPKVLDKVGRPDEPDRPTAKQRRARIDLFKKAISDLKRSGLSLETQERSEITIQGKIEREKAALLDEMTPEYGSVYKLGSKFYIKKDFVAGDGEKSHRYLQCEKNGALRISSLPYFFRGTAVEASDFLRRNPGRYLVRDMDSQKCMLSYSDLTGSQVNLLINKYDCHLLGSSRSNTIYEELANLHRKGIFGYRENLKDANPTAFHRGTKEEVEDFLWRHPRRYIIRDLGNNRCSILYRDWNGRRVEINARKNKSHARGAKNDVTVDQAVRRLHQEGIRGYFKGLEGVPAAVFYQGSKEDADDLLWRYPRTYVIRDLGKEGIAISYSTLEGGRIDIPFKKGDGDVEGVRQGSEIARKIDDLIHIGIIGYSKEAENTLPTVFFRGTQEEADDVLWRYPGTYLIRDLNSDDYLISYSNLDGSRVDTRVERNPRRASGARKPETMSERIAELHKKGIVGYNKEMEKSRSPVFYRGTREEADDFLWRHPGRYLIRDEDAAYRVSWSRVDGRRGNIEIKKNRARPGVISEGGVVVGALAVLHRSGIRGYQKGLENTIPSPVFYRGTKEKADDFLWRYPGRYLVRNLGTNGLMISYSNFDGSRVDVVVENKDDGKADSGRVGETLQMLHEKGIRGYYKGLEDIPPPIPDFITAARSKRVAEDGPPPKIPPPF